MLLASYTWLQVTKTYEQNEEPQYLVFPCTAIGTVCGGVRYGEEPDSLLRLFGGVPIYTNADISEAEGANVVPDGYPWYAASPSRTPTGDPSADPTDDAVCNTVGLAAEFGGEPQCAFTYGVRIHPQWGGYSSDPDQVQLTDEFNNGIPLLGLFWLWMIPGAALAVVSMASDKRPNADDVSIPVACISNRSAELVRDGATLSWVGPAGGPIAAKRRTAAADIDIPVVCISKNTARHIIEGSSVSFTMQQKIPGKKETQASEMRGAHVLQFGLALCTCIDCFRPLCLSISFLTFLCVLFCCCADTMQFPMLVTEGLKWLSWRQANGGMYILSGSLSAFQEFTFLKALLITVAASIVLGALAGGLPYYFYLQMKEAHEGGLLHTPAFKNRLGWLFHAYRPRCYWYEFILLLARFWLLFIGCLVNSPDQKALAAGLCTFVTFCSFVFQMRNNPFDEPLADRPSKHGIGDSSPH